jgi:hypothetical protein
MKKILCFLIGHKWIASMKDYIEEYGYVPLDNRVSNNSVCERCKIKYKRK